MKLVCKYCATSLQCRAPAGGQTGLFRCPQCQAVLDPSDPELQPGAIPGELDEALPDPPLPDPLDPLANPPSSTGRPRRGAKSKPLPVGLIAGVAAPCILAVVAAFAWLTSGGSPEAGASQPKLPAGLANDVITTSPIAPVPAPIPASGPAVPGTNAAPPKPVNPHIALRAQIDRELAAVIRQREALEAEDRQLVEKLRGLNIDKQFPVTERRKQIKGELARWLRPEEELRAKLAEEDRRGAEWDSLHP